MNQILSNYGFVNSKWESEDRIVNYDLYCRFLDGCNDGTASLSWAVDSKEVFVKLLKIMSKIYQCQRSDISCLQSFCTGLSRRLRLGEINNTISLYHPMFLAIFVGVDVDTLIWLASKLNFDFLNHTNEYYDVLEYICAKYNKEEHYHLIYYFIKIGCLTKSKERNDGKIRPYEILSKRIKNINEIPPLMEDSLSLLNS